MTETDRKSDGKDTKLEYSYIFAQRLQKKN